jgi:hypothetical protein
MAVTAENIEKRRVNNETIPSGGEFQVDCCLLAKSQEQTRTVVVGKSQGIFFSFNL